MTAARIFASGSVRLADGTVIERIKLASLYMTLYWLERHRPSAFDALGAKVKGLSDAGFTIEVAAELRLARLIDEEQNLTPEASRLLPYLIVLENGELNLVDYRKFFKEEIGE